MERSGRGLIYSTIPSLPRNSYEPIWTPSSYCISQNQICPGNRRYLSLLRFEISLAKFLSTSPNFLTIFWCLDISSPSGNPPSLSPFQNPENHHLTPVLTDPFVSSKLLERAVTHRLKSFIHQNHILLPEQLGFRKQQSTVCQLARITDCIIRGFNLRKHTGMVLLDIERAYNTVWLNSQLFELISLHLPDYLLFFCPTLEGRTFTVHLNDSTSTPKPTPSGFPQGAVPWATLFSLCPSAMPHPPYTHLTLYTDDTALLSQSWQTVAISRRLSHAVTTLLIYSTTWKLWLNTHKTETILFS